MTAAARRAAARGTRARRAAVKRAPARRAAVAALALSAALLGGCSGAIWSTWSSRAGAPARGGTLASTLSASGATAKSEVLAALGPPGEVLPLAAGDVFVYRVRHSDGSVLNVNTAIFTGITVPLYARIAARQADEALYVMFDTAGRVRDVSAVRP